MHQGTCHCGAVKLKLPSTPEVATACNCSLCRRIGGPWVYFEFGTVGIEGHPEHTEAYVQGDRTLKTIRCRHCGCVTHWEPLDHEPGAKQGVHLGNFDPSLIASVKVRAFDGADSWTFFDEPPSNADRRPPATAVHSRPLPGPATPPFTVERIDHLVFRVRDLDASAVFYESVLGCSIERSRPELELTHIRAGASMVDLVAVHGKLGRMGGVGPGSEGRNVDHLCLRIEPFDEASIVGHLARHGIAPRGPASSNFGAEGEGPSLYIADPDGNIVELKGPAGPEPRDTESRT